MKMIESIVVNIGYDADTGRYRCKIFKGQRFWTWRITRMSGRPLRFNGAEYGSAADARDAMDAFIEHLKHLYDILEIGGFDDVRN
jgi:hypothetical protein